VAISLERLRPAIREAGFRAAAAIPCIEFSAWREAVLGRPGYEEFPALASQADPRASLPEARSIVVAIWDYSGIPLPRSALGKIARLYLSYSDPPDQGGHPAGQRLEALFDELGWKFTATVPRREAAVAAGLLVQRRNCLGYLPGGHSLVSVFAWAVDAEIEPGRLVLEDGQPERPTEPLTRFDYPPARQDPCGNCRLCIDNCPTGALVGPFVLDPTRCIDRNTWRADEWLPRWTRARLGTRVYGCDVCQEVCPFNKRALTKAPTQSEAEGARLDLARLASSDDEEYMAAWAGYFVYNPNRNDIRRNAIVALGNLGDPAAEPMLSQLLSDEAPILRGHAAWALSRIHTPTARRLLEDALAKEADEEVRQEIALALQERPA